LLGPGHVTLHFRDPASEKYSFLDFLKAVATVVLGLQFNRNVPLPKEDMKTKQNLNEKY
jgi:hypothetical protein